MNIQKNKNKTFGTNILSDGQTEFNLWAPDADNVKLCLQTSCNAYEIPMQGDSEGRFKLVTDKAKNKDLYQFKIDDGLKVPDPASRFQPFDTHGASQMINPAEFDWGNDINWKGRAWEETVLYELHVGTFTKEGTFNALKEKLDYIKELGVTAIELMPVADFPGKRNWGYDGVLPYAPDSSYGTPDDLKELIKSAHEKGLTVFLDVVYNHFGPDGNYLYVYAKSKFFDHTKHTPWGSAINFANKNVREFFINNTLYWLNEYHFDGLRFDAIHEIEDNSSPNIIEEISERVKKSVSKDRQVHLVLENDDNEAKYLNKHYTAQWNDDFHHCAHILITGEEGGYYGDYTRIKTGKPAPYYLARSLSEGYAYQGESSPYRGNEPRGEVSSHLSPLKFVNFLQNHDHIGNRAFAERISLLTDKNSLKAAICLYLLAPQVPLLFMGEEWGCKTPFNFFCNFNEELSKAVREGRRREFSRFPQFNNPEIVAAIPDPSEEQTFVSSKINWEDLNKPDYEEMLCYYKNLLQIRKSKIIPVIKEIHGSKFNVINDFAFTVEWILNSKTLQVATNFGEEIINIDFDISEKNLIFISNPDNKERLFNQKMLLPKTVCWFICSD